MSTHSSRFSRFAPVATVALIALAGFAIAGPLNPPVGPVVSTGKTLTEVEPRIAINLANTPGDADSLFKITQSGSYYLTGNVQGVSFKHGIEIAVGGVSIDLNGFELAGTGMALDGVSSTVASLANINIRNGTVRNWGDCGIDLGTVPASNSRISDVLCRGNSSIGILAGASTIITDCAASQNGNDGINANTACVVERCTALGNLSSGIVVVAGSTVRECIARTNSFHGIALSNNGNLIIGNNCSGNGAAGDGANILVANVQDNRIEGNNCTGADRGIDVDGTGNIVIKNTCSGNTTANWSIAAGNAVAPIVSATTNAAAINGNTYSGNLGSTDPNANFTY